MVVENQYGVLSGFVDELELEMRQRERAKQFTEKFCEDISERANTRIYRSEFNTDVLAEVAHTLERKGYPVTMDAKRVYCVMTPKQNNDLRNSAHWSIRNDTDGAGLDTFGIKCLAEPHMPDDTAVVVHESATAVNRRLDSYRPWLVRDNKGVVTVVTHG